MDVKLRQLAVDDAARITRITVQGEMGRRIRDMGLMPNTRVTVMGRAPLYDPVALHVGNSVITLRNNEADHILVAREAR